MNNFKILRNNKGLTQKELSDALSLSERQYRRYEAGTVDIPLSSLIALADYFDVSIDYLVGRKNH
jgi:transcriptional regulator with XRE-family HTH domain